MNEVTVSFWSWVSLGYAVHIVGFLFVLYHTLRHRREPSSTMLWILLAWSVPIIGTLIYISFGIRYVPPKRWEKQVTNDKLLKELQQRESAGLPMNYWRSIHDAAATIPPEQPARDFNHTMDKMLSDYPLLGGNRISTLVDGDQAFPSMMKAIREAKDHVHLQTFILADDKTGHEFLDLLVKKAQEGVTVRLLYDRFGSTWSYLGAKPSA